MRIFDLHNDLITAVGSDEAKRIIGKNGRRGVKALYAVWGTKLGLVDFIGKCRFLSQTAEYYSVEDASATVADFAALQLKNLACCSLTWNYDNAFAGGAEGKSGLTEEGKRFIRFLNRKGIAVDLSHLNERSFWEAIKISDRVLATHSCPFAVKRHLRNLKDRQIAAIVEKGGIVGITPVPSFVKNGNESGYFAALDYFINKLGCDNVALGTDYFGSDGIFGLRDYDELERKIRLHVSEKYGNYCSDKVLFGNSERFFIGK